MATNVLPEVVPYCKPDHTHTHTRFLNMQTRLYLKYSTIDFKDTTRIFMKCVKYNKFSFINYQSNDRLYWNVLSSLYKLTITVLLLPS